MTAFVIAAAGNPTKSPDGALGLLVFLVLALVVYFLFRSMNKHLRKAQRMKLDEDRDARSAGTTRPRR